MVGKWHLGFCSWDYTPTRRGFDSFFGSYLGVLDHFSHVRDKYDGYDFHRDEEMAYNASGFYSTELYADEAERIIKERHTEPFFLYLPFQALHAPMQVPQIYLDTVNKTGLSAERYLLLGMLSAMDEAIGKVVQALKDTEKYNNTIILFTTDNGGSVGHGASNKPLRGTKVTRAMHSPAKLLKQH